MDFTVARTFSSLYIILDIVWLLTLVGLLLYFKRRLAIMVGLVAGLLYFLVDYGIFYKLLGTRQIDGANPFLFLLWLSMSYGFTNFAWIWLLLDRDGHAVEWSLLPILGWVTIGQLSHAFGTGFNEISISRGTGSYHGVMALILCIGYLYIIFSNLSGKEKVNILWLMAIGVGVQFAWEASLLISGIRPPLWQPLVINSLIETNLGMPYIYYIHKYITGRRKEDLTTKGDTQVLEEAKPPNIGSPAKNAGQAPDRLPYAALRDASRSAWVCGSHLPDKVISSRRVSPVPAAGLPREAR